MGFAHGDQIDRPELVERCLHCPYPAELCLGEARCNVAWRHESIIKDAIAQYGVDKGLSEHQIEIETDGYVPNHYVREMKRRKREGHGRSWCHRTESAG